MRHSPYSDVELLEIATGFKKHLKDHFATLNSVCPGVDQNFIFRFKALYYEVHTQSEVNDEDRINQTFHLELEALAELVRSLIPAFRFYLQKAFPYDSTKWQAFGYCEMEQVVHDYLLLRNCLNTSVKLINENRWELKAANCPDQAMDEIIRLAKKVNDTYNELQDHLQQKTQRKEAYRSNLNELFKLMKVVDSAASISLQKDPESLKLLTLPHREVVH